MVGALENVSITKRARPLCYRCGEGEGGWSRVAVHGPFRRFLSSFSPFVVAFYDFVFIYRRTRKSGSQWSRTWYAGFDSLFVPLRLSRRPSVSFFSFPTTKKREKTRLAIRSDGRRAEMKNRRRERMYGPPSSRRSKSFVFFFFFFFFFPRTKCLSFDELASSDLFRLSRSMDRVVNRYS